MNNLPSPNSSADTDKVPSDQQAGQPSRSRATIIDDLVQLQREAANSAQRDDDYQLRRLVQTIRNRAGTFGLLFAVCNDVQLRRKLAKQLAASLPEWPPVIYDLTGAETSLLDTLLAVPGAPNPLVVNGIERLLPSAESEALLRQRTLQEMQLQRERFRCLGRPLLLWMPDYVYALIGQQAHDFWSWQGGAFFFGDRQIASPQEDYANLRPTIRGSVLTALFDPSSREREIAMIVQALRAGRNVFIYGMSGLGKTALARWAANAVRDTYPDGQLFLSFEPITTEQRPNDLLRDAIRAFQPDLDPPDDDTVLVSTYRRILRGKRVLIVLDYVQGAAYLQPFQPPAGSSLLVTARDPIPFSGALIVALDALDPNAAQALLLNLAPAVPPKIVQDLCTLCGNLPLAVRLIGGLLAAQPNRNPRALVVQLQARIKELSTAEQFAGLDPRVTAACDLSYATMSQETRLILARLGIFAASFESAAEAHVCADPDNVGLAHLVELEWLQYEDTEARYRFAKLARQYALAHLDATDCHATGIRYAAYYLECLNTANALYTEGGDALRQGLDLFDADMVNICAGQAWIAAHATVGEVEARLCTHYAIARDGIPAVRLHPRERVQWLEAALVAFERLDDQAGRARVLHQLGNLAYAQSDYSEARRLYGESLAIKEQLGDQLGQAGTRHQLGMVAQDQGDYAEAWRLYGEAIATFERLGDQRDRAGVVGQLGYLAQAQGDIATAERLYGEALTAFEQLGDQSNRARTLQQLGTLAQVRRDFTEAERLYGEALTVFERLGNPRGQASALEQLGLIASAQGDYSLATDLYGMSLAIRQQLGDERGGASVLAQLGAVAQFQGHYAEAERLYREALAIFERLGDQDGRARTLGSIGALAQRQGNYAAALRYTLEALTIFERLRSPNQSLALQKLAEVRRDMGEDAFTAVWRAIAGDQPLPEADHASHR